MDVDDDKDNDSSSTTCFFLQCQGDTVPGHWACLEHTDKPRCMVQSCRNMVYARQRCVHHGGKKMCSIPGCGITRRLGDFCSKHAPLKKRCSTDGCETLAHLQGKCVRHGGGRLCKVDECTSHARNGPYCGRHFKLHGPPVAAPPPRAAAPTTSGKMKAPVNRTLEPLPLPPEHHPQFHAVEKLSSSHEHDDSSIILYQYVSSPPSELLQLDLNDDSGFEDDDAMHGRRRFM